MRAARLVGRALRRRCPNCGAKPIFRTWFTMFERCPTCGLHLDRNESGYRVGSYMLNVAIAELIGVAVIIGVAVATWPDPPWNLILYGGAALMILAPIVVYPFARTLFLALDLAFRPAGKE